MHNAQNSGIPAPSPPGTQCGGSPLTTAQLNPARTHTYTHSHAHTSPRGVTRFHHEYGCAGRMQINPGRLQTDRERQTDEQTDSQQHNKEVVGNENKGPARVEAAQMPSLPALSQPEPWSTCLDICHTTLLNITVIYMYQTLLVLLMHHGVF